jgi:ADP-ribose pyrophosphatase YjhB (NUDIX family)
MGPQVLQVGRSVKAQRRMSVYVAVLAAKEEGKEEAKVEAKVADAAVGKVAAVDKLARAMARPVRAIRLAALAMKAACSRA